VLFLYYSFITPYFIVFQTLSGKCFAHTADIGSSAINMTGTESVKSSTTTKHLLLKNLY
jgi:hypothetical protein